MSYFRIRACRNRHYSIDFRKVRPGDTCKECGQPVIDRCPHCGRFLREWYYYGASMRGPKKESVVLPMHCPSCKAPLPWSPAEAPEDAPQDPASDPVPEDPTT